VSKVKEMIDNHKWGEKSMVSKEEAQRLADRLTKIFLKKGIEIYEKSKKKEEK